MNRNLFYLSTISSHAERVSECYGLGLEIAEYCTAWNMDIYREVTKATVEKKITGITHRVLHAPFNELFPCAIDLQARELAAKRYRQAIALAKEHGASKVIIHGGYNPWIYYPVWYVEQSISFWKAFFQEDPGVEIVLENVLEETPDSLLSIVSGVDNPKLKLCLDVGHVNAYSKVPVEAWLAEWVPYLSHFHIHNNYADRDSHQPLFDGTIAMTSLLRQAETQCANPTYTLELMEPESSVQFLLREGLLD